MIELPDDLIAALDSPDGIEDRSWIALVLDLLRDAKISQGQAARVLGVTRYDILDLMSAHCIPSGPFTPAEVDQEIESAMRYLQPASRDGGG